MTMVERQAESIRKELEKLNARLVREQTKLAKKIENAEKLNANCTRAEWFAGKREEFSDEQRWAFSEVWSAQNDVDDTTSRIASAEKRLAKISGKVEAVAQKTAEAERIDRIEIKFLTAEQQKANAERKEAEYRKWLSEFKAECLKDGIEIDKACSTYFSGKTASGKRFFLDINNGWTVRSRHCYSLRVAGETIFTSGEFQTAYRYLMK